MTRRIDRIDRIVVAAFVVRQLAHDGKARDPRAYPVSVTEVSLDEALQRAAMTLPSCAGNGLRYGLFDNGFGYYYTILLQLEAPEDCVNDFLAVNHLVTLAQQSRLGGVSAEKPLPRRNDWMDGKPVRAVGWDLGADQPFQKFSVRNEQRYGMSVLAQHIPGTSAVRAYVYASHGG
ncbi:hypothetical protein [Dactylosporangium sp. CA-233914]|uniref:hypothetical protein n=1 Tax=Dactylosporangium sp. CA-233914 TaxID=3239934 RepID=UPI003D8AE421